LYYTNSLPKLLAQPLVQNNVNVNIDRDGEGARRKLEDAFMRLIEARKYEDVDPAVYINNERVIEHQPSAAVPRPVTDATRPATDATPSPTAVPPSATAAPRPRPVVQSFVPGQAAGFALDGSDDKRSTTEKFLSSRWYGDRPP